MRSTTISPNGIQLTRLALMNCYLVRERDGNGEDSFTLIDTTISGAAPDILAAAALAGAPIRRILLTHAHVDHVGSVDALMARLPQAQLAAPTRSLPLLQMPPDKSLQSGEPTGKIKGGLPGIRSTPTHLLSPGELYGSLRCIDTSGHIPGHFSYLDERDGTIYAGDALIGVRQLSVSGFAPWYFPFPNLATWNKAMAIVSARRLVEYPVERFACGHGRIHSGGIPVLREVIAEASR